MSCLPLKGWDFTPHAQALNKQRCFYIAHQNIVATDQRIKKTYTLYLTNPQILHLNTVLRRFRRHKHKDNHLLMAGYATSQYGHRLFCSDY